MYKVVKEEDCGVDMSDIFYVLEQKIHSFWIVPVVDTNLVYVFMVFVFIPP